LGFQEERGARGIRARGARAAERKAYFYREMHPTAAVVFLNFFRPVFSSLCQTQEAAKA
jgi:hypothetical protein